MSMIARIKLRRNNAAMLSRTGKGFTAEPPVRRDYKNDNGGALVSVAYVAECGEHLQAGKNGAHRQR